MTRIWMLCLLTALLHSAAYAAKPNAENPAKGKPAVAAENHKTDTDRKASDDEEDKKPPSGRKKSQARIGDGGKRIQPLERNKGCHGVPYSGESPAYHRVLIGAGGARDLPVPDPGHPAFTPSGRWSRSK